jgi:4-alpha-glucanotransferase
MSDGRAWGIEPGYTNALGEWQDAPRSTIQTLLTVMGATSDEPPPGPPVWMVREGDPVSIAGQWELHLEDGAVERVSGSVPNVPLGYHQLFNEADGRGVRLIVTPGRCHLPPDLRTWGWAVQLYAMRSQSSWGMGDLGDLRRLAEWSASTGAGMALLNPLHASVPVVGGQNPSPYYPSSRCFRSPLYLRIEDVPGASALGEDLAPLAKQGQALNDDRMIDRDKVLALKLEALEKLFRFFPADPAFDRYVEEQGEVLRKFALHCALAEKFGPSWNQWPVDYRHPDAFDVRHFAEEHADRVRFHQWLQWLVDLQLQRAGEQIDLMQDLAIGVDPGGADAWIWQDVLAADVSVGAPPDEFNTQGQDWGLPPLDPWKLRDAAYEPFVQTVRAGFRHAGGLRFDHVMGLFRLYWIPRAAGAAHGTYVRYPSEALLDILALESVRAGAYVVGEDLGTVEDEVREALADRNVLSYRLLWFEPSPPRDFPERALGAVTTHDLPTVAGLWTGADLEAQDERDMAPNVEGTEEMRSKLQRWVDLPDEAPVDEVVRRTYSLLAEAPSALVTASLDDVLGIEERPNYPGTTGGTNWSLALPVPLEEIEQDERVMEVARNLSNR